MAFTQGFASPAHLTDHFTKHGALLGATTEMEYLDLADQFFGKNSADPHLHDCTRSNGDKVRYNDATEEWGVIRSDGVIRTYYILTDALRRYGSGWAYFQAECAK